MREITSKYKVQYPLNKDLTETQIQILSLKKKKKKIMQCRVPPDVVSCLASHVRKVPKEILYITIIRY